MRTRWALTISSRASSEVSEPQIAEFLAWLNDFSERENIQFTLSLSMDPAVTGSEITKYMI